jgi:glutamine amidotransferase
MNLVIIDYGAGNIQSIIHAFGRLGVQARLTKDAQAISSADRVIFPGVGAAGSAMSQLRATGLDELIPQLKQPVLGICLGMQLMCRHSEENNTDGLGIFQVDVVEFDKTWLKVPQMGWNNLSALTSPLFDQLPQEPYVYMVHSYYAPICDQTAAVAEYGIPYSAALHRKNFWGTQFHPEKSSQVGSKILQQFLSLTS